MAMCEDYPACGHTDGLGCDWVSPNEIQLCMTCADARVAYPYHQMWENSCPTLKAQKDEALLADAICDCGDEADAIYDGEAVCWTCYQDLEESAEYLRDQYTY